MQAYGYGDAEQAVCQTILIPCNPKQIFTSISEKYWTRSRVRFNVSMCDPFVVIDVEEKEFGRW